MTKRPSNSLATKELLLLALVKLVVQMAVANSYGLHRDEYLYLAQTNHLDWGYIEVPPMLAILGKIFTSFGDGIYAVKLLPALVGSASVFLTGLIAKELGGRKFAQLFAAAAFLIVPAYLRSHHLFQPVFLNQFVWLILTLYLIRLINRGDTRLWPVIGVIMGLGMLTKYSVAFPILGLISGLLLTNRQLILNRWFLIGGAIALVIFAPNFFWQLEHKFPVLGHMEELRETQLVNVSPGGFMLGQVLMLFSVSLVWIPGLISLFTKRHRDYMALGIMYLVTLAILLLASGKDYYLLGMYPALIAAGAVWWENTISKPVWRGVLVYMVIANCIPSIPYGIPILPVEQMERFCAWMKNNMGLSGPLVWEDGVERSLPQDYADMFGWEEMVQNVSRQYHSLSEAEQRRCNIWGGSYGHAGALLYYADKYELPNDVTSFNGSFTLWAKDEADFDSQIMADDRMSLESEYWNNVVLVDSTSNPYARDPGYVFYRSSPRIDVPSTWRTLVQDAKSQYTRK